MTYKQRVVDVVIMQRLSSSMAPDVVIMTTGDKVDTTDDNKQRVLMHGHQG